MARPLHVNGEVISAPPPRDGPGDTMALRVNRAAFCLLAGLLAVPLNCSDNVDCFQICSRYSECVTNIDVTECTDLCEDGTDDDDRIRQAAQNCEECLDRGSCAETTQCFEPDSECSIAIVVVTEE